MAKNKVGMKFSGFEELMSDLDKLGGDLKKVTTEALIETNKYIAPKVHADMKKHKRTGETEKSIYDRNIIEWDGFTGQISVGFEISNGGLPSIFLMYGTPRMKKDTKLYNDIYGSKTTKEVGKIQEEIIQKAIMKRMG